MKQFLLIALFAALALTVSAQQTIVFHPKQWRAELEPFYRTGRQYSRYPAGTWQHITGPKDAKWLVPRLVYRPAMHLWEVWEGTLKYGDTVPLHDGEVVTMDDKGTLRIKGL
jgi:hypothetical protein